jgi:hypothetical protein
MCLTLRHSLPLRLLRQFQHQSHSLGILVIEGLEIHRKIVTQAIVAESLEMLAKGMTDDNLEL